MEISFYCICKQSLFSLEYWLTSINKKTLPKLKESFDDELRVTQTTVVNFLLYPQNSIPYFNAIDLSQQTVDEVEWRNKQLCTFLGLLPTAFSIRNRMRINSTAIRGMASVLFLWAKF